ncbi:MULTISPECIES: tetratricopeptide repeat protein [Kamptonema]|uniref:tetratricopeptide repeat protein n=1 Tax=Kamptonema TaxID=1501433 RepID=UPI0001DAD00C|nr:MULTISPECIES: tetratricopeptide repeat protein [Kamptonema]CBN55134.1 hypothetical protein OSCI_1490020 [Kamptonema sp. PCC 6506]
MNQETAVSKFNQGKQLQEAEKLEDKIAAYRRGLELNSNDSWTHHHLGENLAKLGRWNEAIVAFCDAITLKPDFSWSYHHLGDALAQQQQWEDSIAAFRKALELNPEHYGTYVGLGNSLAKLGQWDEAIAAYSRASELNPDADWIHFALANAVQQRNQFYLAKDIPSSSQIIECNPDEESFQRLGEIYFQLGQWDDAIATYRRAVELNPFSDLLNYQLGEAIYQRVIQHPESFFVDYKIGELPNKKNYQAHDRELPGLCFINDEQFLQATQHLDDESYAVEAFRVYKRYCVSELEKQACVNWLRLPESSREIGIKYWRSLPEFQVLLKKSITSVCLNQALLHYRQAIELNRHHIASYYRLGEILAYQEKLDEGCETYYKLAVLLAEQGKLDEALTCFQKAPHHSPSEAEIYESLWKGLNELAPLDVNNSYYRKEIKAPEALAYFNNHAKYTVIGLEFLSESDKILLEEVGLSLANLELMRRDSLALEEIYINSFGATLPIQLAKKESRTLGLHYYNWSQGMHLQQSLVETGYIYTVCPFTGKVLRSNQSFVIDSLFNYYRFVGQEVFYYLVGDWFGSRICLYFPKRELIIPFYSYPHINFGLSINRFKTYLVTYWQKVKAYLSNKQPKELVAVQAFMPNLGHYIWNDLAGIYHIVENGMVHHLTKFIIGAYEFMNVDVVFPEIETDKIIRFSDSWQIFQYLLENNYCGVRLVDMYIKDKLSKRLYQTSLTKCSQEFLQQIEASKQDSPLLLVTLRSKRSWVSQVEGIANVLNLLYADFPNLGVIFDGWSRTEREDPEAESVIAAEKDMMEKIITRLSGDIKTYSLIGATTYETLVWSDAIDFYITPMATSLTFVVWTAHKPGVTYGNTAFYGENVEFNYSSRTAENSIMPVFVPKEFIVDGHDPNPFSRSYECDWKAIYNEIFKLLKEWQNDSAIAIKSA